MSKNNKMTKLIAIIMSMLLVLFTGYGLSQAHVSAQAEEKSVENVQTADTTEPEHDVSLDPESPESGDTAEPGDSGEEDSGDEGSGDEDPVTPPSSPVTMTSSTLSVEPGDTFTLKLSCPGISMNGTNKLSSLSMSMTKLPSALNIENVKVLAGTEELYNSSDTTHNNGIWDQLSNGTGGTFKFGSDYLTNHMSYDGTLTPYILELTVSVPNDKDALSAYKDTVSGNAIIPLTSIEGTLSGEYEGGTALNETAPAFTAGSNVSIAMPKLHAVMTMDPTNVQVYGTVRYNVTITSANATASQIVIHDVETDALARLGIVPTGNPSVSIDGTVVELPETAMTVSNGNITITLPQNVTIPTSQALVVSYSMKIGSDELKEQGKLSELLALTTANRTRSVTVSAANAFDDAKAEAAFNILVPSVSDTVSTSDGDTPELTTGGKVQITSKFDVLGDEGATLINPSINVTAPTFGTIDNIKVNGSPYNRGDALSNVNVGQSLIVTYDVTAPADYEPEYNAQGILAAATLKADNIVNNVTSSVTVKLAIPATSISIEAHPVTPSASSTGSANDGIVHVKTVLTEASGVSALNGYQLSVSESLPAGEGNPIDPAVSRFQNVKINGETANVGDYTISGTTITFASSNLAANGSVTVEYDDYMKSGYEQNGASCNIVANVQAAPSSTSNFPGNQAKTATTTYTIQTPLLHIAQEITGPVTEVPADSNAATSAGNQSKIARNEEGGETTGDDSTGNDEPGSGDDPSQGDDPLNPSNPDTPNVPTVSLVPDVINVGDVVTYKTTFYEDNPDMPEAIGRNFSLKVTIDDLVIDAASTDKTDDKESSEKKEENTSNSSSSKTYKASQLGITFGDVSEIKLLSGENDVTESFDIALNSDKSELSILPKEGASQDCPSTPTSAEFSVKMGAATDENNFDQLSGNDITVRSTLSVSNLEKSVTAVSTTTIADAKLSLSMAVSNTEIGHGMTNTYTITAVNDKENKFGDSSKARNVTIENALDDSSKEFGYKIDPSSLTVMLEGKDITSTSDVTVKWSDDNTGFDMTLSRDLPKEQDLVLTYSATTDGIDAQAYSETLGDVAIATADNSKPAVAYANILYTGADFQDGYGAMPGAEGYGNGTIGATGDILPYVFGGIAVLAVIGGIVFVLVRRRNM